MDNKLKDAFNFPAEGWDAVTCSNCQSPFHEEKDCPQSKVTNESKFKFLSRKEMGLERGSLPFKFQVDIDPANDDEVEIARKRALLRLNTNKVYNLMGLSVKAQESQKEALRWLLRLADELDVEDDSLKEERDTLLPLIQILQTALRELTKIRQAKIKQAVQMEEVATKARNNARKVRIRKTKKKAQEKEFWVLRLPDSNVDVPIAYDEDFDPANLFKEAADAILEKEKEKANSGGPDTEE